MMEEFPNVYFQALSDGTGFIAIDKVINEIKELNLIKQNPRFISVKPDGCAPMAHAWEKAVKNNFPEGWTTDYPIYENPQTIVPTLATGNQGNYRIISELTRKTDGDILIAKESKLVDIARLIAYETTVRVGPASALTIGGFFEALKKGLLHNGDNIMINIGEGVRRAPDFMEDMIYTTEIVKSIDECKRVNRADLKDMLWSKI